MSNSATLSLEDVIFNIQTLQVVVETMAESSIKAGLDSTSIVEMNKELVSAIEKGLAASKIHKHFANVDKGYLCTEAYRRPTDLTEEDIEALKPLRIF